MTTLCVMVENSELTFAHDLDGRQILAEEMAGMKRSSISGTRDDAVMTLAVAAGKVGECGSQLLAYERLNPAAEAP